MKDFKISFLVVFVLFSFKLSYSQELERNISIFRTAYTNTQFTASKDIQQIVKRTNFLIRKHTKLAAMKGLRQYHIFELYPCGSFYSRRDYENGNFLLDLEYGYVMVKNPSKLKRLFTKGNKYMRGRTIVTDSLGNLVAYGDASYLFFVKQSNEKNDVYQKIAKLFYERKIDYVFYTLQYPDIYVCITANNMFVIESQTRGLITKTWEDFLQTREGVSK
ncbi:MAG: hypothetical protein J6Z14_07505 [Prevotella sp.]|nr:hypothetical protein [Prevotella sp.]